MREPISMILHAPLRAAAVSGPSLDFFGSRFGFHFAPRPIATILWRSYPGLIRCWTADVKVYVRTYVLGVREEGCDGTFPSPARGDL